MGNFDKNKQSSSRDDDKSPRQMHKAVCNECGSDCEVPFKPSSDKPIYCSRCFQKYDTAKDDKSRGGRDRDSRGGQGGRTGRDRPMHKAICDRCGKSCELPFKPTGDKPVYCKDCFGSGDSNRKQSADTVDYTEQLAEINEKLDLILRALKPIVPVKSLDKDGNETEEIKFRQKLVVRSTDNEKISLK